MPACQRAEKHGRPLVTRVRNRLKATNVPPRAPLLFRRRPTARDNYFDKSRFKMSEVHRYEQGLRATLRRIELDPKIHQQDKLLIQDFIEHCRAQGQSFGRRFKLSWTLQSIARLILGLSWRTGCVGRNHSTGCMFVVDQRLRHLTLTPSSVMLWRTATRVVSVLLR